MFGGLADNDRGSITVEQVAHLMFEAGLGFLNVAWLNLNPDAVTATLGGR